MPPKLLSDIMTFTKGLFEGEIVDNQLNPNLLTLATNGYSIQSQTLRIPDRFGLFSPKPPRLQVHQASVFIVFVFGSYLTLMGAAFTVFLMRLCGLPNIKRIAVGQLAISAVLIALLYLLICCSRRRAPGYEWEDWKVHND